MVEYPRKPRLTHRDDVMRVVEELRKFGISGMQLYRSVTEIGPVDLDILNDILRAQKRTA
ncbi:MAG TPA: hypothetical protein VLQ68_08915 [Rhizobiaceae bacterium]|nr:hypothetical protein [Rhizobiaceae bacterium]